MPHTPGPWQTAKWKASISIEKDSSTYKGLLCQVDLVDYDPETQAANAKLIAASPTLLAVCEMDDAFPDLNIRNYDESDVEKLLAWSYEVIDAMRAAKSLATVD
jgi:hypothetical protein